MLWVIEEKSMKFIYVHNSYDTFISKDWGGKKKPFVVDILLGKQRLSYIWLHSGNCIKHYNRNVFWLLKISSCEIFISTSCTVLRIVFICMQNSVNDFPVIEFWKDGTRGKNTHPLLQKTAQGNKTRVCSAFLTPQKKNLMHMLLYFLMWPLHNACYKFNQVRGGGLDMRTKVS